MYKQLSATETQLKLAIQTVLFTNRDKLYLLTNEEPNTNEAFLKTISQEILEKAAQFRKITEHTIENPLSCKDNMYE